MFHISIPDELDKELSTLTLNKEEFILDAVKQNIDAQKRKHSNKKLAKEYEESGEENRLIMEDYKHTDKESWNDY